ncbi:MAG: IseA DL-endopeptidase inhibitor family protein [Oscillospiraceae bacterium]|nr:IseA DL-endopeptidase inhibitor family protein [Oscillospiraceae bacterium]
MSYQSKKLWDEVLDNLDPKYANEAAELFGKQLNTDDEEYGELVPVQAQKLQPVQSKKRIIGSIVGFAAAAAVLAISVVTAVKYVKNDNIVQPDPNDSSVSQDSSTAEAITYKNILDDINLPTDPSLYSEDYSVYEKYFCGKWKKASPSSAAEKDKIYYVGYAPSDNVIFGDYYRGFGNDLIGFYEDEHGAYMSSFEFMDDDPNEVFRAYIVFAPADDPDTLYLFRDYPSDSENRTVAPDTVYVRDGEYTEDNGSALNYFGVRRLCMETGIAWDKLFCDIKYNEDDLWLIREAGILPTSTDNVVINYRGDDRLEYAIRCAGNNSNATLFYNLVLTKENGEWGEPVLADRIIHYNLYDLDQVYDIPENTGEKDYAVLEEYFFGEWDRLIKDDRQPDTISTMYSDRAQDSEEFGGFSSVFRNDDGAFAFTDDGGMYFVPENSRQLMYYVREGESGQNNLYRLRYCAAAESRDLYGELTKLGRSRLFETLGDGFEDCYNYFMEYSPLFVMNSADWRPIVEEPFICAAEIGDSRVALVQKYYEVDGESTAYCVAVFEKNGGEWEYANTYYDLDYDYTTLVNIDYNDNNYDMFELYEDIFIGEWICDNDVIYNSRVVFSYSEEPYGMRTPYKGDTGYYFTKISGGAGELYYIPYSDTDTMYFYNEGVLLYDDSTFGYKTEKREYSWKYSRSETQFDTELHDMMTLGSFGREKLFDKVGEDFRNAFRNVYNMDYIIDHDGVSWSSGLQGTLYLPSFDPVLVSMDDEHIVISQTYIQSYLFDDGHYDDAAFEKGTLKNFILTFTKQDGVWSCNITDAGESIEEVRFSMDMSLFPYFFGVWSDGEVSYTLDFYNDFLEPDISKIYGFAETSSEWLMKVHRVAIGKSDIIPVESGDVLFVIEKDDPATTKVYEYAEAMQKGEPLRTYTRTQEPQITGLPDRGYISIYGLYALIQIMDSESDLERSVITEYCISGSVVVESGERLYTGPTTGMSVKSEYVILERSYDKIKLATTFYSDFTAYDYIVTFRKNNADEWYLAAYEPAIYGLDGAEKVMCLNRDLSYYAFNRESDGTHLYYYDQFDNIIYELDEEVRGGAVYVMDDSDLRYGSNLFVAETVNGAEIADSETWVIRRYVDGKAHDVDSRLGGYYAEIPENAAVTMVMRGSYLVVKFEYDGGERGLVYYPSDIAFTPIMVSDYIEILDDGFVIREGEELKTYTADGELENVLPLLKKRADSAWSTLVMSTDLLNPSMNGLPIEKDGMTYYRTDNPLFPSYTSFENYLKDAFTDELTEELLDNCNVITWYGYEMYAVAGGRGGDITIAEVRESEPKLIDENTAEIICDVYRWTNMEDEYSDWVMGEEPDETYSLYLEKTDNGWRFSSYRQPY